MDRNNFSGLRFMKKMNWNRSAEAEAGYPPLGRGIILVGNGPDTPLGRGIMRV
jgi:hypothetical protein